MCRIAGFFGKTVTDKHVSIIGSMVSAMKHGGPDYQQVTAYPNMVLGHARLSILDLSNAANQPYEWTDYIICYNGEIYNFKEIRKELAGKGYQFQSDGDTEVIIKAYDAWGIDAFKKFRGMFAFALWDGKKNKFLLVRDRMGVKPLYYVSYDNAVYFFSELKSIRQIDGIRLTIDKNATADFLQRGYIGGNHCIFEQIQKVKPGTILEFESPDSFATYSYWNLNSIGNPPFEGDYSSAKNTVLQSLRNSIEYRLVSDVPVGIFLSGGIDSSLVTAIASKDIGVNLQTFNISFDDKAFDESHLARMISRECKTEHHEFKCNPLILIEFLNELPFVYDEPFADASAIPTLFLSKMTSKYVKVALGGDGGDEVFGGYTKYTFADQFRRRKYIYKAISILSQSIGTENAVSFGRTLLKKRYRNVDTKIRKFIHAASSGDWIDFFNKSSFVIGSQELNDVLDFSREELNPFKGKEKTEFAKKYFIRTLGLLDIGYYLTDDLLVKLDRASMRYGLEAREPLLDHTLMEIGLSLPDSYKVNNGETKFILRDILSGYLPEQITKAPKSGFTVPVDSWLKNELYAEVNALKNDHLFCKELQLNQHAIQRNVDNFYSNQPLTDPLFIWNLLMLYKWYKKWVSAN
ncbi:asparagine synthase (glutamine-hydrolysing) [Sediminibacterium magnilacihabitans]|nr:asparagine synthase (glutamine-hydrolysing) [Sediminibacterium magnilacihabitans]